MRTGSFKDDKNKTERTHHYSTLDRDKYDRDRNATHRKMEEETLSRKLSAEMKHLILGRTKSADDDGKAFSNMKELRKPWAPLRLSKHVFI